MGCGQSSVVPSGPHERITKTSYNHSREKIQNCNVNTTAIEDIEQGIITGIGICMDNLREGPCCMQIAWHVH